MSPTHSKIIQKKKISINVEKYKPGERENIKTNIAKCLHLVNLSKEYTGVLCTSLVAFWSVEIISK